MKIKRLGIAAAFLLAGLLAGCGGGGSSTPATGTVNVALTDGPGDDYDHVWVTVKAISFHTDPNAVWSSSDATWQTTTLPAPVTLDLANLTNGALNQVFAGLKLPAGTYRQIRIFLAGFNDPLTASASAASLTYNDQVDYTDSSGTVNHVPLEIATPIQGIQLNGTFNVAAGASLNLALDFNLEQDLVRFASGTGYRFTMKPNLAYFDLDHSGAITGNVDPTHFCTLTTGVQATCAYNLIVKAEVLSADGSRHVDVHATRVKPDGSFVLYPLPSALSYDVLIRGRNMDTMLVKGVTATAGSTPASGARVLSTSLAPIPLNIDSSEYFVNFSAPLAPTSGYAKFQQTLPTPAGGVAEVPYDVRWGNTNPFTGLLAAPMALSKGPLYVTSYSAGSALTFTSVTPEEGLGGYTVASRALPLAYYSLSTPVPLAAQTNTVTTPYLFSPPAPVLTSPALGTVSGSITQATPGTYDSGYLLLTHFGNIVKTVNIGSNLTASSIPFSVSLPAGTAALSAPGAYYYGYLIVWNSAYPLLTLKVVSFSSMIDLRSTNTVSGLSMSL